MLQGFPGSRVPGVWDCGIVGPGRRKNAGGGTYLPHLTFTHAQPSTLLARILTLARYPPVPSAPVPSSGAGTGHKSRAHGIAGAPQVYVLAHYARTRRTPARALARVLAPAHGRSCPRIMRARTRGGARLPGGGFLYMNPSRKIL